MQICLLSAAEAKGVEDHGFSPDCHLHKHLSKWDARQAAADGRIRSVNHRAVFAVIADTDSPKSAEASRLTSGATEADTQAWGSLSNYWYDDAVNWNDRYLGTAQSGGVRTTQLMNFMPRGMKHKVRGVRARGAQGRLMPAKAVNAAVPATDCVGNQE